MQSDEFLGLQKEVMDFMFDYQEELFRVNSRLLKSLQTMQMSGVFLGKTKWQHNQDIR
jgi:hypothetical protein